MAQETTKEFAYRLEQALEAYPHAPPTPHGRLTWLKRELEKHAGIKVSVNTVHKWVHGLSRPREDNVRALARLLQVDEIWLTLGRKPSATAEQVATEATRASGAVLLVAGLIEINGGRVIFPSKDERGAPHLRANLDGEPVGIIAVTPQGDTSGTLSFVIPEPVGQNRVIAVIANTDNALAASLVDMTDVERQTLGGFSVAQLKRRKDGRFKALNQRALLSPMARIEEIAP